MQQLAKRRSWLTCTSGHCAAHQAIGKQPNKPKPQTSTNRRPLTKQQFDERKGPTWHCIVGRNFGSFVTHGKDPRRKSSMPETRPFAAIQRPSLTRTKQRRSTSSTSTSDTAPSFSSRRSKIRYPSTSTPEASRPKREKHHMQPRKEQISRKVRLDRWMRRAPAVGRVSRDGFDETRRGQERKLVDDTEQTALRGETDS